MNDEPERVERNDRRVLRIELIIAIFALLTSACASVAAIMQAREGLAQTRATIDEAHSVAVQLGASVWPYVTIDKTFSPRYVTLGFTNQGLGPALIRSFTITIHGKGIKSLSQLANAIDPNERPRERLLSEGDFGGGSVLRPSQYRELLKIADAKIDLTHAEAAFDATGMTVCYCSLLQNCWTTSSSQEEPRPVRTCGAPTRSYSISG